MTKSNLTGRKCTPVYFFREHFMNSQSISRLNYELTLCSRNSLSTTLIDNAFTIYSANSLWINCLFREFTMYPLTLFRDSTRNSLSISVIHYESIIFANSLYIWRIHYELTSGSNEFTSVTCGNQVSLYPWILNHNLINQKNINFYHIRFLTNNLG